MANLKREPVSYRPFRVDPLLSEGLLGVERSGGELEAKVSNELFAIAERTFQEERARQRRDTLRQVRQDVFDGRPTSELVPATPASAPPPRARGARFAPEVSTAIDQAAQKHGVDRNTLTRIAQLESGGNPRAKNPRSSAGGLFQFIDTTAREYGLGDRFDAAQSADAAARLLRDNTATLRKTLGREPTSGELYLAHQQGAAGAAKLLANPDRPASDVVGVEAVNRNGGRPGMSAGEFARLWVDRAEQGYVLPAGAPAGPMPGDGPRVKMSGGTWRPSGKDTVLGRLYDEEGAKLYLQTMEQELVNTLQQSFDLHKNDPQKLREVYATLKQEQREQHVFDSIAPEWEISFDAQASRFLRQAGNDFQQRQADENRLAFLNRVGDLETARAQAVASFDPASDDATDAIQRTQNAIDAHYDDAVVKGVLTPQAAEQAKRISRNESALGYYTRQAETMASDDVAGLRETMRADFAAGRLDGLDGDGWAKLDARLAAMERTKRTEDDRADTALDKRGKAFVDRAAAGYGIDQAELGRFLLDANTAPNGRAIVDRTLAIVRFAETVKDKPIAEAADKARELRKAAGPTPNEDQIAVIEAAEGMVETTRKSLERDLITHAETAGIIEPTASLIDAEDGATAAAIIARRVDGGDDAAAHFGVRPRYLKAGEAAAIEKMIRADPARGAAMAGAIVSGAGPRARDVLAEFGNDAPMIAEAGAIIAFGGSARAAEDVIGGYGRPDGKALKGIKAAEASESFRGEAGTALVYAGDDMARIERAAAAITRKRIAEDGLDPASDEALAVHARAVHEAAGAVFDKGVQFGGFAEIDAAGLFSGTRRVLVSPEIRTDRFEDVIGALRDEDLAALPVKPKAAVSWLANGVGFKASMARTLSQAVPIAVAGGYVFALGDPDGDDPQLIEGEDGRAFVLDVLALKERLSPRVPGGFR